MSRVNGIGGTQALRTISSLSEFNSEALVGLLESLGRDGLISALELCGEEVAESLRQAEGAVKDGDIDQVRRAMHRIKGMLLQFGATGAVELAQSIERADPERIAKEVSAAAYNLSMVVPILVEGFKLIEDLNGGAKIFTAPRASLGVRP